MITMEKLTPMLRMTDAEIDACLMHGLYGLTRMEKRIHHERKSRREECHYDRYADDWEREGDD